MLCCFGKPTGDKSVIWGWTYDKNNGATHQIWVYILAWIYFRFFRAQCNNGSCYIFPPIVSETLCLQEPSTLHASWAPWFSNQHFRTLRNSTQRRVSWCQSAFQNGCSVEESCVPTASLTFDIVGHFKFGTMIQGWNWTLMWLCHAFSWSLKRSDISSTFMHFLATHVSSFACFPHFLLGVAAFFILKLLFKELYHSIRRLYCSI